MADPKPGLADRFVKWMGDQVPTEKNINDFPLLRPFAKRILRRELWRFTRRSVPRGAALGFLTAIIVIIPGFQILVAALLALPLRANIPVAAATTFVNTPITTPPLLVAAYVVGAEILRLDNLTDQKPLSQHLSSSEGEWLRILFSEYAPATGLGLIVIAVVGAALSYLLAGLLWRIRIVRKRKKQLRRHHHS